MENSKKVLSKYIFSTTWWTKNSILAEQLMSLKIQKTENFSLFFYAKSQCLKRLLAEFLIMHSSNINFLKKVHTFYLKIHTQDSSYERKMVELTIEQLIMILICFCTVILIHCFWFEECIIRNSAKVS